MKNLKDNIRNKQVVASLFVIGLILMVIGVSYAMYTFTGTGTKENVITTGQITVEFAEQNNILIQNRYPETDAVGLASTDPNSQMTFTVSSNIAGVATVNYAVGLTEIEEGATLTEDYIKINLTKNGSAATGFTTTTGNIIGSFRNEKFGELLTSHVIARGSVTGTQTDTYTLKAWIHENYNLPTTDTSSGKVHSNQTTSEEFSFKIKVAGTDATTSDEEEPNIPNAPELATNMIPVTYDGTNWVKADSTNANDAWYNYDNKVWANAVTVSAVDGSRSDLVDAPVGTSIPMERINTMMVWIPRFSATVGTFDCSTVTGATYEEYPMCYDLTLSPDDENALIESGFPQETLQELKNGGTFQGYDLAGIIELYNTQIAPDNPIDPDKEFNSTKIISEYNGGTIDAPGAFDITFVDTNTTAHDAFTFGSQNLSGMWIGKFENSSNEDCVPADDSAVGEGCNLNTIRPKILPNKESWRGAMVSTIFYDILAMTESGNQYGFDKTIDTNLDTHMLKNSEWGAVAYLTQSIYGRCSSSTSCTEIGINNNSSYVTGYGAPARSSSSVAKGTYETSLGKDASTTGNIYGVYDMSGGADEYVMGVYWDGTKYWSGFSTSRNNHSGFNGWLYSGGVNYEDGVAYPSDNKYYNVYTTDTEYLNTGLQHAISETSNWYSDNASFVSSSGPWFDRGGHYSSTTGYAGVFYFYNSDGSSGASHGSRLSVAIN